MSKDFKEGMRDSIGFGIGFIFLYLAIGMLGITQSFSGLQILATTVFVFSTPLQFLLIQSANNAWLLIPAILTLNARFLLMSATLAPYLKQVPLLKMLPATIFVTPSTFTGCLVRFRKNRNQAFLYFLGIGTPIYIVSILCTVIGFAISAQLKSPILFAMMDIILPLQFTALAAKHWPDHFYILSYWSGFILTPILIYVFHNYNLLITPFIIGAATVLFENQHKKAKEKRP